MSRCATIIWFPLISDSTHFQYVFGKNQRYHHCQLLHISTKNIDLKTCWKTDSLLENIKKKHDHVVFSVSVAPVGILESNKNHQKTVPCAAPSSNTPANVSYQLWQIPIDSYIKWPHYKELQRCINATLGNSNGPTHYHHPQVEHNHRGSLSPWHLASRPR